MLDKKNKHYNWVSEDHMMLCGEGGHGDSIGRTFEAFFCYKDLLFVMAVIKCWIPKYRKNEKLYLRGYRYPPDSKQEYDHADDMSRDHFLSTLFIYAEAGYRSGIKKLVKNTGWRISEHYTHTIDTWLYARALNGSKIAEILFYLTCVYIPPFIWITRLMMWIKGIGPEYSQEAWKIRKPKQVKFGGMRVYALLNLGWMLYYLPESPGKRLLKYLCRAGVPRHNYVLRMLFGLPVSRVDVLRYQPMTGGRWSTSLDARNDRDVHIIEPTPDANNLDVELVRELWAREYYCPLKFRSDYKN